MKLLTKTNIFSFATNIVLFAIGLAIVYKVILAKLDKEADRQLLYTKSQIIKGLNDGISPNEFMANIGQKIYVRKINKQSIFTNIFIEYAGKEFSKKSSSKDGIIQRELLFQTKIGKQAYEITICISLAEGKQIGEYISIVVFIFLLVSFFLIFLLNRYISDYLWSPFNDTLSQIKTWNIKKQNNLNFKNTDIDEFHLLNDTLKDLTQQIKSDYLNLKEFTENVSHETQTPLAIISTKIEMLMQETNYTEKQNQLLVHTYNATQRLYKLNKGLILLTRIENKQFIETSLINLAHVFDEKINILEDFLEAKSIVIERVYNKVVIKEINADLLSILLDNLLINAIKYNLEESGMIKITIDEESFSVENTSFKEKINPQFLFERFNKNSISGSLGLGLSLIKRIVDFYNWHVSYSCKDGIHKFKIYL